MDENQARYNVQIEQQNRASKLPRPYRNSAKLRKQTCDIRK